MDKVNLLDTIPVRSEHIRTEWKGEYAVLAFPRFKHRWAQRFLLPKGMSPDIRVTLEERGTAVWQLIDGQQTVENIISSLAPMFGDGEDYAPRVTAYILQLRKDGFIRLVVPQ